MFPSDTYLKVIKYLNITIAQADSIHTALSEAEAKPEVEAEVTEVLGKIATLEAGILAERSSPNSAMIRADVVEWEGGGARSRGMIVALNLLKQELANLLGLEWEDENYGFSGVTVLQTRSII